MQVQVVVDLQGKQRLQYVAVYEGKSFNIELPFENLIRLTEMTQVFRVLCLTFLASFESSNMTKQSCLHKLELTDKAVT